MREERKERSLAKWEGPRRRGRVEGREVVGGGGRVQRIKTGGDRWSAWGGDNQAEGMAAMFLRLKEDMSGR